MTTRRSDRALLVVYHEARLAELLEHVRVGLAEFDAGRIDAFELDGVIHHYTRAAQKLWTFCAVSGAQAEVAVRTLEAWKKGGHEPDWWQEGAPRRGR